MNIRKKQVMWEELNALGIAGGGAYYTKAEFNAFFEGEDAGKKQVDWARITSKPGTFPPSAHTLASHSSKAHSELTGVTSNQHHNKLHSMTGVQHSAAGLTVGHVLRATAADAFAWGFLTKLGTINTGVWQGTPIANAYVAGIDQNLLQASSPTFAGLIINPAQIIGGFGAEVTSGTLDWNHITNARSGGGYTLLLGTATNGPGPAKYFHPFSFEYSTKDGSGNMTQFAIPYNSIAFGPYFRYRYGGDWTSWVEFWTSGNDGLGSGLDADKWHGYGATGLTVGHVLKATGASAFAFQANNLAGLSDVNIQTPLQYQGLFYIDAEWVNRPEITYDMPYLSFKMYTEYFNKNEVSPWTGYSVNSGNVVDTTGAAAHPGIVRLTSVAQANSGYRYQTGGSGGIFPILIGGKEMAEIVFKTKLVGAKIWYYGYHNSNTPNVITNGVYLYVTTLGRIYGVTKSVGLGSAQTATYYQLSNNTWYRARLEVNSDATRVDFWLYSEAGQELWTNNIQIYIPTAAGKEVAHSLIVWYDGSAANDLLDVDMMAGYCSRPLARG